ncbi:uncharacterized protein LOC107177588 isoform X2 [Citrus sinensis]|uniref:uncharacterized protein LOC107177588 isoform X2 n=1 Tax=Citrus sinensis TaxID=2711 RepID=UPI002279D358|nr:uncharacterized protein LOC107177588 isoform X2 [Citrus sinensis]
MGKQLEHHGLHMLGDSASSMLCNDDLRRLLAGDFTSNLKLLQNYPPTNISHLLYVANNDKLGLSLDLGSFIVGVMISTTDFAKHTLDQEVLLEILLLEYLH